MIEDPDEHVRCYDNGGATYDRYTVVFAEPWQHRGVDVFNYVAMNHEPFHPMGFGQHGESSPYPIDFDLDRQEINGEHLGRRIRFADLPGDCQRLVRQDLRDLPAEGVV